MNNQSSGKPETRKSDDSPVLLMAVKSRFMKGVNAGAPAMVWCAFAWRNAVSFVFVVLMAWHGYFRDQVSSEAAAAGEIWM